MSDDEALKLEVDLLRARMQACADLTVVLTEDELRIERAKQELEARHEQLYTRVQEIEVLLGERCPDEDDLV